MHYPAVNEFQQSIHQVSLRVPTMLAGTTQKPYHILPVDFKQ